MAGAGSSEPADNGDGTRGGFVDPSLIRTRRELAAALDELRGDLSYSDLTRSARAAGKLSSSTLNDILRSAKITQPKLSLFLIACRVPQDEHPAWLDAWERTEADGARPTKAALFFRHLLDSHTALFSGREDEIRKITDFIRSGTGGYVFVEALSGYGKTSLLARLVATHPHFHYHFVSQRYREGDSASFDPTRLRDLLQNLCEQLDPSWTPPASEWDLRADFNRLIETPSRRQRVIVLDAIDEMGRHPNALLGVLPYRLPPGLVIVLSARTQGQRCYLSEVGLSRAEMGLILPPLPGLNESAIADLLRLAGGSARRLADDDAFVADLHLISAGDPFYLRFLAEDVAMGILDRATIERTPSGLPAYLDNQFAQLAASAHLLQQQEIIALILASDQALSRYDLIQNVDGLNWLNFDSIVADIHRFLLVFDNKYSFCHDRIREYCASKLPPSPR